MSAARVSDFYRTAFITGASSGLGQAFAAMLLGEGVRVSGTSRDVKRLEPLATAYPGAFTPVKLDLSDTAGVEDIFLAADRAADGFDLVINNAGYSVFAEYVAADFEQWREQVGVMLIQPMRLSQTALRMMLERVRGGRGAALVNISSLAAEFPLPFQSAYNVVKAGLSALNESLMIEVAGSGVIVVDFRPGDYRTGSEAAVIRPMTTATPRVERAWESFVAMMRAGRETSHAAAALRRALMRRRSGTVRTGPFFQAVVAPFLARFGSLSLRRRFQARYFQAN